MNEKMNVDNYTKMFIFALAYRQCSRLALFESKNEEKKYRFQYNACTKG